MGSTKRMGLLRGILLVKVFLCVLAWGLPSLLAPASIFDLLGVSLPDDTTFVRLFGSVVVALGLLYWFAYRDPIRNVAIIKYAVADNALATVTGLVLLLATDASGWMLWSSAGATAFFTVAFAILMPRE